VNKTPPTVDKIVATVNKAPPTVDKIVATVNKAPPAVNKTVPSRILFGFLEFQQEKMIKWT
jgi:hypothetical protein